LSKSNKDKPNRWLEPLKPFLDKNGSPETAGKFYIGDSTDHGFEYETLPEDPKLQLRESPYYAYFIDIDKR
jgi:hypothetical protein